MGGYTPGDWLFRKPTTGIAGCCARAANGHAATPLPTSAMKSRRLMGLTPKAKDHGRSIAGLWSGFSGGCRAFTRVFPKNRCQRAAPGIFPGTKKFFCKKVFRTKATLYGTEPFFDRFLGEGA